MSSQLHTSHLDDILRHKTKTRCVFPQREFADNTDEMKKTKLSDIK